MKKLQDRTRARNRLDERLLPLRPLDRLQPPPKGWIRAIRDALGMSGPQLARRVAVAAQTIERLEKSEAAGTIQLSSLRRVAQALDCTLVYALVPNSSLEETVGARTRDLALRALFRVSHSMLLEAQETSDNDVEDRIAAYIRDELNDRDVWSEG